MTKFSTGPVRFLYSMQISPSSSAQLTFSCSKMLHRHLLHSSHLCTAMYRDRVTLSQVIDIHDTARCAETLVLRNRLIICFTYWQTMTSDTINMPGCSSCSSCGICMITAISEAPLVHHDP